MKKLLTHLSFLFFLNQADSQVTQEWAARYNGPGNSADHAYSVAVDGSGNVYTTGYVVSDLTGDEIVDGSDAAIADNNAFNFMSVVRP